MKKKENAKQKLINRLKHRIKLLEITKQHYEQNPTLLKNLKIANIELVQNDIETLKEILSDMRIGLRM